MSLLDGMIEEMQHDLAKIKRDAEAAQSCLESEAHSPGAVSKLRTQLDKMAEGLLENRQLLDNKIKGEFTYLVAFYSTWQRSVFLTAPLISLQKWKRCWRVCKIPATNCWRLTRLVFYTDIFVVYCKVIRR